MSEPVPGEKLARRILGWCDHYVDQEFYACGRCLAEQLAGLERYQAEAAKAIRALKAAGDQLEKAVEELMTEFISKKRAANWKVIKYGGYAFAKAKVEHEVAIQRAREQT